MIALFETSKRREARLEAEGQVLHEHFARGLGDLSDPENPNRQTYLWRATYGTEPPWLTGEQAAPVSTTAQPSDAAADTDDLFISDEDIDAKLAAL